MVVACVVCARPADSLLASGLHAGVAVLAMLTASALVAIAWGAWHIAHDDALAETAQAMARAETVAVKAAAPSEATP